MNRLLGFFLRQLRKSRDVTPSPLAGVWQNKQKRFGM
jgi:hypothetical protein